MSNEEAVDQPIGPGVGSRLRDAREGKGLEIADIANAQHLRPSVIQAIENGDYKQIDSELFLKGYVRAYAGQVGLNPDSLISQLDHELEPMRKEREQARESNPLVTIEERKRRKKRIARIVIILLFLGVAAFIAYKVFFERLGRSPVPEAETVEEIGEAPESGDALESEGSGDPVLAPDTEYGTGADDAASDETIAAPEPEEGTGDVEGAAIEERTNDNDLATQEPAVPGQDTERSGELPTVDPDADVPLTEPEPSVNEGVVSQPLAPTAEPVRPPEPVTPLAASGEVNLQASFVADCWVLVTDGNGDRLVSSLRRSGDRINVSGQPPLQVVIGAVDAIGSVSFQGEALDLRSYRVVNNRAEFTLGN